MAAYDQRLIKVKVAWTDQFSSHFRHLEPTNDVMSVGLRAAAHVRLKFGKRARFWRTETTSRVGICPPKFLAHRPMQCASHDNNHYCRALKAHRHPLGLTRRACFFLISCSLKLFHSSSIFEILSSGVISGDFIYKHAGVFCHYQAVGLLNYFLTVPVKYFFHSYFVGACMLPNDTSRLKMLYSCPEGKCLSQRYVCGARVLKQLETET